MINRILIYNSGGGIGDSIQILPLINTLKKEFKNANFFYLGAHKNYFNESLKDFNCPVETLNLDIQYFGFRWWHLFIVKNKVKKYDVKEFDLIIDLQSKIRNSLILKMIPHKHFISSCFNFYLSKPKIKIKKKNKMPKNIIQAINTVFNIKCKIIDFQIDDINQELIDVSKKLLPKNNYVGLSITQGNIYRKKEWPLTNIISLCSKLKKNRKIPETSI